MIKSQPKNKENSTNLSQNSDKTLYFQISTSKKVSKEAIKIYLNNDTDEFHLSN